MSNSIVHQVNGNIYLGSGTSPNFNNGINVMYLDNPVLPAAPPITGVYIYSNSDKLEIQSNNGTKTIVDSSGITVTSKTVGALTGFTTSDGTYINGAGTMPAIDGITLSLGDSILVDATATLTDPAHRGIYVLTNIGGPSWQLTRATYANSAETLKKGVLITIAEGVTMGATVWIHDTLASSNSPIIFNTTALSFSQVNGGGGGGGTGSFTFGTGTITSSVGANIITSSNANILLSPNGTGITSTTRPFQVNNSTISTTPVSGALTVVGGIGVGANSYFGGQVHITDTTLGGTNAGSFVTAGGASIAGNLYLGSNIVGSPANTDISILPNGTGRLSLNGLPTADNHAVTKIYVDGLVNGLLPKQASRVKTTTNDLTVVFAGNYTAFGAGSGKYLEANLNGIIPTIDGITVSLSDRVLWADAGSGQVDYGIYVVSSVGSIGTKWRLTRSTDTDNSPAGEVVAGIYTFITAGTVHGNQSWTLLNTPVTLDVTPLTWTQSSGGISLTPSFTNVTTSNITIAVADTQTISTSSGELKLSSATGQSVEIIPGSGGAINIGTNANGVINVGGTTSTTTTITGTTTNINSRTGPVVIQPLSGQTTNINQTSGDLNVVSTSGAINITPASGNINLNPSSTGQVNVNTGTSSGSTLISGQSLALSSRSAGNISIAPDTTGAISLLGTTNINTSGTRTTTIGGASTTNIFNGSNAFTNGVGISGPVSINTSGTAVTNIGTSSYSGIISIGTAGTSVTNMHGIININPSGTGETNIKGNFNVEGLTNINTVGTDNTLIGNTTGTTVIIGSTNTITGVTTINGTDSTSTTNIGTGSVAKTIIIGNATPSTTSIFGTVTALGAFNINTSGTSFTTTIGQVSSTLNVNAGVQTYIGTININSSGTDSTNIGNPTGATVILGALNTITGDLDINGTNITSSTSIGTGTVAKTITIGNTLSTTEIRGTVTALGAFNINTSGTAFTTTIGQVSSTLNVNAGTQNYLGAVNINTSGSTGTNIGNATSATGITGTTTINGITTINGTTSTSTTNIGTGTVAKTITIGNTTPSTTSILGTVTALGAFNINTSGTAFTTTIGQSGSILNVNAGTQNYLGAISINPSGTDSIAIGNNLSTSTSLTGAFTIITGKPLTLTTVDNGNINILGNGTSTLQIGNATNTVQITGSVLINYFGSTDTAIGNITGTTSLRGQTLDINYLTSGTTLIGNATTPNTTSIYGFVSINTTGTGTTTIGGNTLINTTGSGTTSIGGISGTGNINIGSTGYTGNLNLNATTLGINAQSIHSTSIGNTTGTLSLTGIFASNTNNQVITYDSTNKTIGVLANGTNGQVLTLNSGALTWQTQSTPASVWLYGAINGLQSVYPNSSIVANNGVFIFTDNPTTTSLTTGGQKFTYRTLTNVFIAARTLDGSHFNSLGGHSVIFGNNNKCEKNYSNILGGKDNLINCTNNDTYSTIVTGDTNSITSSAQSNTIINGTGNLIANTSSVSTIVSGAYNSITGFSSNSTIGNGTNNTITESTHSTIIGGNMSTITGCIYSLVGTAENSTIRNSNRSVLLGGDLNNINDTNLFQYEYGFIGCGKTLSLRDDGYSCIVSGNNNAITGGASDSTSFIGGGKDNDITSCSYSSILGGSSNTVSASYSVVSGGLGNTASGQYSFVGGGGDGTGGGNVASGLASAILGGRSNTASGDFSIAMGQTASAIHSNSFVFSSGSAYSSSAINEFSVRADGGIRLNNIAGNILLGNASGTNTIRGTTNISTALGSGFVAIGNATNGVTTNGTLAVLGATSINVSGTANTSVGNSTGTIILTGTTISANGALTVLGTTLINTTNTDATSVGNTTGAVTLTGSTIIALGIISINATGSSATNVGNTLGLLTLTGSAINANGSLTVLGTTSINATGTSSTSVGNTNNTLTLTGSSINATGPLTILGATSINTSNASNTSIGNTGTLTLTGSFINANGAMTILGTTLINTSNSAVTTIGNTTGNLSLTGGTININTTTSANTTNIGTGVTTGSIVIGSATTFKTITITGTISSATANNLLVQNSASNVVGTLGIGTTGQVLTVQANGTFAWQAAAGVSSLDSLTDAFVSVSSISLGNAVTPTASNSTILSTGYTGTLTGTNNTIIGTGSGNVIGSGTHNTVIGAGAGNLIASTTGNTILGSGSGTGITSGSTNTILGRAAGNTITTGTDNILIGSNTNVATSSTSNAIVIGNTTPAASNTMYLPSTLLSISSGSILGITTTGQVGPISTTSDLAPSEMINFDFSSSEPIRLKQTKTFAVQKNKLTVIGDQYNTHYSAKLDTLAASVQHATTYSFAAFEKYSSGYMALAGTRTATASLLAYSYDGERYLGIGNTISPTSIVLDIAWNGFMWMVILPTATGIYVGKTPQTIRSVYPRANIPFSTGAHCVCAVNNRFYVGGASSTVPTLAWTLDGYTWVTINVTGVFTTSYISALCFTGTDLYIMGSNSANTIRFAFCRAPNFDTISSSSASTNIPTGIMTLTERTSGMAWNGKMIAFAFKAPTSGNTSICFGRFVPPRNRTTTIVTALSPSPSDLGGSTVEARGIRWTGRNFTAIVYNLSITTGYIYTSTDGVGWIRAVVNNTWGVSIVPSTTPNTNMYSLLWTGNKMIVGGQADTSVDGQSIHVITENTIVSDYTTNKSIIDHVSALADNSRKQHTIRFPRETIWVGSLNVSGNTFAFSDDGGLNYDGFGGAIFSQGLHNIFFKGTWFFCGVGGTAPIYYLREYDQAMIPVFMTFITAGWKFATDGNILICVGTGGTSIVYSYNGYNWMGITTFTGKCTDYYSLAYTGTQFIAGGLNTGGHTWAYSIDGISWISGGLGAPFTNFINGLESNGIITLGGGYDTGATTRLVIFSNSTPPVLNTIANDYSFFVGESLGFAWNGSKWCAIGEDNKATKLIKMGFSDDGYTWRFVPISGGIFDAEALRVMWAAGKWHLTGTNSGAIRTIYYTTDERTLTAATMTNIGTGGAGTGYLFPGASNPQNGYINITQKYVLLGAGPNSIATSEDGYSYKLATNAMNIFTTSGNCGKWNGNLYTFGGAGTNTLAYSYDLVNYVGLGTGVFSVACNGITYSVALGIFVAVGEGTNTIAISTNGISWTGVGSAIFTTRGTSVIYENRLFVATGAGTNAYAWSTDGINWTGGGISLLSQANCVAWGYGGVASPTATNYFVIGGQGSTNAAVYSSTGTSWLGVTNGSLFGTGGVCKAVSHTGRGFLMVGYLTSRLGPTGMFSTNASTWTDFSCYFTDVGASTVGSPFITTATNFASLYSDSEKTFFATHGGVCSLINLSTSAIPSYIPAIPRNGDYLPSAAAIVATTSASLGTFTGSGDGPITSNTGAALPVIDGVTLVVGDYVLLTGTAISANTPTDTNAGVYRVNSVTAPWVLARASNYGSTSLYTAGMTVAVRDGTVNAGTTWVIDNTREGLAFPANAALTFRKLQASAITHPRAIVGNSKLGSELIPSKLIMRQEDKLSITSPEFIHREVQSSAVSITFRDLNP
jgi:collagen type VII alpha